MINQEALVQLFIEARTHNEWLERPVSDDVLRQLYDIMKWGPTSANLCPARIVFVRTPEGKARLLPCVAPGNVEKVRKAPVTAMFAFDMEFYRQAPVLFPARGAEMMGAMAQRPADFLETFALRNSSLQGGYFILAARSLGLDCGPMSGFDNAKVDAEFFAAGHDGTLAEGEGTRWHHVKSNFLCNIGYGDKAKLFPRNPRFSFDQACKFL
jgi:3-hydroxypropanoate dehydrogenase